ncbi:Rrf2 family transcriptional regulator [uncultured Draconibacterium sp.]|uniref:RrF2 family transcriptional regulator n=1 Tax=uncultured Draconibacterium sp. TaxID=1573823 RepID=UPI0032176633
MFKKETEYALRGLVYIRIQNLNGRSPGISEISTEIETPQHYMAKILQRLVRMGFIQSIKGKNGGYSFNSQKPDLTLKEVIVSIEGDELFEGCGFGLKHCDEENPCPLHFSYAPIRDALNKLVNEETIQSLAGKNTSELDFVLSRK